MCGDLADVLFESGFSVPVTKRTMADIPLIKRAVSVHCCIVPIKAELDQMVEGMS